MIYDSALAEQTAVLAVAQKMCVAARTAPKAKGVDHIETCIVTGEDLARIADEMERLAPILGYDFFMRDAQNLRQSQAAVLIGTPYKVHGLNEGCGYCNYENCAACEQGGGVCVYSPLDLGIAIGSAASVAADMRVDSRIMFSVGRAALGMEFFPVHIKCIFAIPLSVSGKSPYFDRT